METLTAVYKHPLLGKKELELLFAAHTKVSFKKGDRLLENGRYAQEYFCVESGLIRSFVINHKGMDITTAFAGKREIVIDVISLFNQIPAIESLEALTACVCYKIGFDDFQKLYHSLPGFNEWGRSWMAQSLFQLKERSVSMITDSAGDRYLDLMRKYPEIIQNAPLKHVASYLGITDTSLSRIRKDLSRIE